MELGMWGAVDMDHEAIVGDDVLASAHGVNAGCEAIDGDDILAGTHVVDVSHEAIEGGKVSADTATSSPFALPCRVVG